MDKREALTPQELQWLQEAQEAERFDESDDMRREMQVAMAAAMQRAAAGPHAESRSGAPCRWLLRRARRAWMLREAPALW